MKTTVVVPTYNEAENLRKLATALLNLPVPDLQVLVVDDESPDGTGAIADELSLEFAPHFHVLHRNAKSGLGTAYIDGFTFGMENGADYLVQMDADFSHSPDYIP